NTNLPVANKRLILFLDVREYSRTTDHCLLTTTNCFPRSTRCGGRGTDRSDGRERCGLLDRDGARTSRSGACGGALCFSCRRASCFIDSLARHELVAKLHLQRDFVNILCLCAALRTTNNLFQAEQFCLI